ncbi:MAG TPA: ABC transporter substrate-binding protein [Candidatus Didemnitutus sp.]|nr:ABC transporter substrate-binding protein [Candidatus Didemnitutus sp.]
MNRSTGRIIEAGWRGLVAALFSLLAFGCSKPAAPVTTAGGLVKVRFQTDWFPQPEHGGYYEALAKGYYAEEGLDVELVPGGPNAQVMAMVATGRADLGMTNGDDVIVAIARGVPIKMVAAEMQRDAQGIMYHAEHPVHDLRDLNGRTIMAGAGSVWLQYAQKTYGIKFNLLPLVGDLARFMNDPTYVQQCFVTNEPYFARQRGANVGAFLIAGPGYEPYRVMFTSDRYIKDHPALVEKFVRASIRGWTEYLTGDAEPANKLILKLRPDLTPEFAAYSIRAMKDYQLVLGDPKRDERMGQLTVKRLETQIGILQKLGVLDHPVEIKDVVDFEFLPDEVWPGGLKRMLQTY